MKILPNQNKAFQTPGEAWNYAMGLIDNFGDRVITEDGQLTKEVMNLMVTVLEPQTGWPVPGSGWDLAGLNKYAEQLLSDGNPGFDYTYGERINLYPDTEGNYAIDQLDYVIEKLKRDPTTRRAIAITWVPDWDDHAAHVPCLQSVDFLFRQDKLHLTAYFRSQDVSRAWPANLYGLSKLLSYVGEQAGMRPGSITTVSASAHIYER